MKEKDTKSITSSIIHHPSGDERSGISPLITVSTIAGLDTVDALHDLDMFEISVANDTTLPTAYLSRAVTWQTLFTKLQTSVFDYFDIEYRKSRYETIGQYFDQAATEHTTTIWKFINNPANLAIASSLAEVVKNPTVWNDVYALAANDLDLENQINGLDERLTAVEQTHIAFGPSLTYSMTLSTWTSEDGKYNTRDPEIDSLSKARADASHGTTDGWTLAFFKSNNISTTYTTNKNGMLVMYGWLDSSNVSDLVYLPNSWCALEANINGSWEILQLAQVLPKRQLTYVSFTVPVVSGLTVRLRTGFIPGPAGNRYSVQSGYASSLSNDVPNAFFAGVYEMKGELPDTTRNVAYIKNPVGTMITNVAKPKKGAGDLNYLPGDMTWAWCNGCKLDAALYPELAEIMVTDEDGYITLPNKHESANAASHTYIKIK